MLRHDWPAPQARRTLDIAALHAAVATGDVTGVLDIVDGVDIDDALQQVAAGIAMLMAGGEDRAETLTVSVINRLALRGWEGDNVLAEDLLAVLRRSPLPGRVRMVAGTGLAHLVWPDQKPVRRGMTSRRDPSQMCHSVISLQAGADLLFLPPRRRT
jgi:hypothetical protein